MITTSKRPVQVALICLILNVLFFGISFFLGRWSGYSAISTVSWLFLSVALICFVLSLQFYQRVRAEQEKLDMSQLTSDQQASTIFQAKTERDVLFTAAQNRLDMLEKWFIPIFSGVIAVYQISIGLYLLNVLHSALQNDQKQPLLCAIFLMAMAFVSFLLSRYATGMSAEPKWKPLRAGGSAMLCAALLCFGVAIVLAVVHLFSSLEFLTDIAATVISGLLIVLGAETALNLIMDIYRPRLKGQYSRSAFDSRLLGIINEPGGILRSAADAIDYQFGFKVSQTWFYKLLEQAIVPLILFAVVTLYLMSCIVVVEPNEQAIIERLGNPINDANNVRLVGPGLTFKLPWPIDVAYKYPTTAISEIGIGYLVTADTQAEDYQPRPKLWGRQHYDEEYHLLVATEQTFTELSGSTVPVSLVIAAVPVQYRINNLYNFIYNHNEPEKLLEAICYRELTRYAASAKIEVRDEAEMGFLFSIGLEFESELNSGTIPEGLRQIFEQNDISLSQETNVMTEQAGSGWVITDVADEQLRMYSVKKEQDRLNIYQADYSMTGKGRAEAARILTQRVQAAADEAGLGVEIVFLGLQGVHPPIEVAADYQKVTGAVQKQQKLVLDAQAERIKTLGTLVGSIDRADELSGLAEQYRHAQDANSPEQIEELGDKLDEAFGQASGEIFRTLRESQSYAFEKETLAEATGRQFANQLKAFRAAPEIYVHEQLLAMYEQALSAIRKYVVVADQNDTQITVIDLQEKLQPGLLDDLADLEESSGQ